MLLLRKKLALSMTLPFSFIPLGGQGPILLLLHATGFHGRVLKPLAALLSKDFKCIAVDLPGHGTTAAATSVWYDGLNLASQLAEVVEAQGLRHCFCFGHSGGAALALLAEATHPGTFAAMYLYEAVVSTPEQHRAAKQQAEQQHVSGQEPSSAGRQLAHMAMKRQAVFDSPGHAYGKLGKKLPFSAMHPDVLAEYFKHGLVQVTPAKEGIQAQQQQEQQQHEPVEGSAASQWVLACTPTAEASWYTMLDPPVCIAPNSIHCPVLFAGHVPTPGIHSQLPLANEAVAAMQPKAQYHSFAGLSHFGPLEQPGLVARHVREFLGSCVAVEQPGDLQQGSGWQQEEEQQQQVAGSEQHLQQQQRHVSAGGRQVVLLEPRSRL